MKLIKDEINYQIREQVFKHVIEQTTDKLWNRILGQVRTSEILIHTQVLFKIRNQIQKL